MKKDNFTVHPIIHTNPTIYSGYSNANLKYILMTYEEPVECGGCEEEAYFGLLGTNDSFFCLKCVRIGNPMMSSDG